MNSHDMKFFRSLLVGACWLGLAVSARAAEAKPQADLEQVAAAAATYESGQSVEPFRQLEEAIRESEARPAARKEVEAALIRMLGTNSTFEARRFACKQLGIVGSQTALPALAQLLTEPETAGIACLALTTYPTGKADEVLRAGLRSADSTVRVQLINTLGDRQDAKSVPLLARFASGSDAAEAEAALAALGKIGTPAAWKATQSLRNKSGDELAPGLTEALLRFAGNFEAAGSQKASRSIYEDLLAHSGNIAVRRSALSQLFTTDLDGGRKRILEVLSSDDTALMPVAITAIAAVPSQGASEEFAALMHHLPPEHQALMVETLAARGDDAARLQLAKALSVPEPMVRRAAISALGRMGDPYFVSLLVQALGSATDPEEARSVEAALVGMKGGAETDKLLADQLKLAPSKARAVLIATIARRQGPAASKIFLEETANTDPLVAKAALRALAKVGTAKEAAPVIARMVELRDAGVRTEAESTASQLLAKMPEGQRSVLVCEALGRATTSENRNCLIPLLPGCGDAAALLALQSALGDAEPEVRDTAVRALAEWPNAAAWKDLLDLYRRSPDENSRAVAFRGLVRLLGEQNAQPDGALIDRYKELLASARSDTDLKLLLGTLANVEHPDALPLVSPLLGKPGVRAEAALAVRKIADSVKAQHPQVAEEALNKLKANP